MAHTHILTALYPDDSTAERAMERLRAAGLPGERIESHRAEEGDVVPGQHPSGGLLGAMSDLLAPSSDETRHRGVVVVASGVSHDLASTIAGILEEDSLEVDDDTERSLPADEGGVGGTPGGFGRAIR